MPSSPQGQGGDDFMRCELDALTLAEAQGYDAAWLGEADASRYGIAAAILHGASSLSARTQQIRIGVAVTWRPFFHPLRIAEELAMLDLMSAGRLDCAVALEKASAGASLPADVERHRRVLLEQLAVVKEAWIGLSFAHAGEFFDFPSLECFPTPHQAPHPPLLLTAGSAEAGEWAAAQGYPLLVHSLASIEGLAPRHPSAPEATLCMPVYVGETDAQAQIEAGPALVAAGLVHESAGSPAAVDLGFERGAIVGDAARCKDEISQLQARVGLDCLLTWQSFGDLSPELSRSSQQRFIEEVAPAFR